jgi:hypothetical protein
MLLLGQNVAQCGPGSPAVFDNEERTMLSLGRSVGQSLRLGTLGTVAALALLVPASAAQTPVSEADTVAEAHPAHIHAGSCAELGEVVMSLESVMIPADAIREGAATAHPVKSSQTLVDMPLQDLLDGGYAVNVHLSAEAIDTYIACGDIGGYVVPDPDSGEDELYVGLRELNDSGHTGAVRLGEAEYTSKTEVSILLVEPDAMQ